MEATDIDAIAPSLPPRDPAEQAPPGRLSRWTGRSARWNRWLGAPGSARRIVALSLVAILIVSSLALFGIGETSTAQPALDGGAWLGSANGTLVHANGVSGRIDWTTSVAPGTYTVSQAGTGGFLDMGNGRFLTIDGASMTVGNTTDASSPDVEIDSGGGHSYVVYRATGLVQEVDPQTLDPVGNAVDLAGPVSSVAVDATGTLYAALTDTHEIAVVARDRLASLIGGRGDGESQMVAVGTQVAAVDASTGQVAELSRGRVVRNLDLGLPAGTQLLAPASESGSTLWLTDVTHKSLIGVDLAAERSQTITLSRMAKAPGPPQPAGTKVYLYDSSSGDLTTVDTTVGTLKSQKLVAPQAGVEFFAKDGLVYVNAFDGPQAFVANDRGEVIPLTKYATKAPATTTTTKAPGAKPEAKLTPKPKPAKKFVPHLAPTRPGKRFIPRKPIHRVPRPRPRPVRTTTTTSTTSTSSTTTTDPNATTTTTDPNSTTTTTDPNSTTTTTDPNATTTTTTDPNSTTTTTDPNSTTTTVNPTGP